jgi:hypothetical protein
MGSTDITQYYDPNHVLRAFHHCWVKMPSRSNNGSRGKPLNDAVTLSFWVRLHSVISDRGWEYAKLGTDTRVSKEGLIRFSSVVIANAKIDLSIPKQTSAIEGSEFSESFEI